MLHRINTTETVTSMFELSQTFTTNLKVWIYTPDWMNEVPNTELDPADLILTPIKNGAHGKISSYALMITMLVKIETGVDLKTALDAADQLNEIYHSYDVTIEKYHERWLLIVDCPTTKAEIAVDLTDLVNW